MYFKLPNKASSVVEQMPEPWNFQPGADVPYDKSKKDFEAWGSSYETEHAYISMYEGLTALVRVSDASDNPVYRIHGLIVDYDSKQPENVVEHLKEHPASEFKPNWFVSTVSGNCRLVWEFESPFMVASMQQVKQFLKIAKDKLLLHKWLSGFDAPAYGNPTTYFEIGKEWIEITKNKIPLSHLDLWFVKSLDGIRMETQSGLKYQIPIEDIAKEVNSRFPGRWRGEFALKTRGVRFWDGSADNPSAAVVFPDGMYCFTGSQPFVTWREIFGAAFVEKYEADYLSGILSTTVYDGSKLWVNIDKGDNVWEWYVKEDFTQHLKVMGFDATKSKGKTSSEIDNIENAVKMKNRVKAALPFLYKEPGVMTWSGHKYVNTSRVKCMQPATCPETLNRFSLGRKYFPFLYDFFKNLFMGAEEGDEYPKQLSSLLAELKFFYVNSLEGTPRNGHAVFIAGPADKGKTFFASQILGKIMGGTADASDFLVGDGRYTARLVENPVALMDDTGHAGNLRLKLAATNKIKKLVSNHTIVHEEKYKAAGDVPWPGRVYVMCNTDEISLRILPDLDSGTKDKLCLYKATDAKMEFPSREEMPGILARELPFFCRFLCDMDYPAAWPCVTRFGPKHYHHPELVDSAQEEGSALLVEMIVALLDTLGNNSWEGSAHDLHTQLQVTFPETARAFKPIGMGTRIGLLHKTDQFNIEKIQHATKRTRLWKLSAPFVLPRKTATPSGIDPDESIDEIGGDDNDE